jgi:cell wall-associated NlpC family hydrolase
MSTEQSSGESSQKPATQSQNTTEASTTQTPDSSRAQQQSEIQFRSRDERADTDEKKPAATGTPASKAGTTTTTSPETPDDPRTRPRQVIAVSASKGPAAFFNLARKFLVTDDMCDLSALEGAIVSAADAAHLLERSKLATIVR